MKVFCDVRGRNSQTRASVPSRWGFVVCSDADEIVTWMVGEMPRTMDSFELESTAILKALDYVVAVGAPAQLYSDHQPIVLLVHRRCTAQSVRTHQRIEAIRQMLESTGSTLIWIPRAANVVAHTITSHPDSERIRHWRQLQDVSIFHEWERTEDPK